MEHVRVFAGERCGRCVVESTQRLLDGRLTSDDANSTSHTLAWLCTSEAPCWDRGGRRRRKYEGKECMSLCCTTQRHTNWGAAWAE